MAGLASLRFSVFSAVLFIYFFPQLLFVTIIIITNRYHHFDFDITVTYLVRLNRHLLCIFIIIFCRLILFSFLLTINHYCENLLWYQSFRCRSVYVRDLATTVPSDILAPVVTWLSAVTVMTFWLKNLQLWATLLKKTDKISRAVASLERLTSKKYGYDTWSMYSCSHIDYVFSIIFV